LYASAIFTDHFRKKKIPNLAIASPDVGGIKMARSYAKRLESDLILIDKRRPRQNEAEVMNIIGEVEGKNILIVDDLIDTAGTFCNAAQALKESGALDVYGACTHPILSGQALERIAKAPIKGIVVTDSIPVQSSEQIEVRSASKLFAEAILRTHNNQSISSLFDIDKG
jgi:ribose-phosphate pyrophosphokinase